MSLLMTRQGCVQLPQVEQMIILFVFCGNYTIWLFAPLVPVKRHSLKVSYTTVINHKTVRKRIFRMSLLMTKLGCVPLPVRQMIILFVLSGNYTNLLFASLVPVKCHSMNVSYEILTNHKNFPKIDFSDVSLDDKTGLFNCHW